MIFLANKKDSPPTHIHIRVPLLVATDNLIYICFSNMQLGHILINDKCSIYFDIFLYSYLFKSAIS